MGIQRGAGILTLVYAAQGLGCVSRHQGRRTAFGRFRWEDADEDGVVEVKIQRGTAQCAEGRPTLDVISPLSIPLITR